MSTKLYTGFKLKTHSLDAAVGILDSLKPKLKDIRREATLRWLANRATTLVDRLALSDSKLDPNTSPFSAALEELRKRQFKVRASKHRDPEVDFSFEVVLFKHPNGIFGLYFAEQEALTTAFLSLPEVEDFSYWDNTDQPERISEEEWASRKATWGLIFQDSWVPSEVGASLVLLPEIYESAATPSDLLPFIPGLTDRLQNIALDIGFQQFLSAKKLPTNAAPHQFVSAYREFSSEFLVSEVGIATMSNLRQDLSTKVPLIIGVNELLNLANSPLVIK